MQIEKLTVAGARFAAMGLRSGHLVSLGTAIHDTMQVTGDRELESIAWATARYCCGQCR